MRGLASCIHNRDGIVELYSKTKQNFLELGRHQLLSVISAKRSLQQYLCTASSQTLSSVKLVKVSQHSGNYCDIFIFSFSIDHLWFPYSTLGSSSVEP